MENTQRMTQNEKIKAQFIYLQEHVRSTERAKEDYLVVGVLNDRIGCGEDGIREIKEEKPSRKVTSRSGIRCRNS